MPTSTAYEDALQAAGAVNGWRFDDPSGPAASDWIDARPGAYGGTFTLGVPGPFSDRTAVHVTGGGRVDWVPSVVPTPNSPLSIWARPASLAPTSNGVIMVGGGATGGFNLQTENTTGFFRFEVQGFSVVTTTFGFPDLNWHHILLQQNSDGGWGELWLDGVKRFGEIVTAGSTDLSHFTCGAFHDGSNPWSGDLAEFAGFTSFLPANVVQSLYQSGSSGTLTGVLATSADLTGLIALCTQILNAVRKTFPTT